MSALVFRQACNMANISVDEVRSPDRTYGVHFRRACVIYVLHNRGWSSVQIGKHVNRDHATVLFTLKRFPETCYTWHYPVSYERIKRRFLEAAE